jgi:hypothetical protein
MRLSSWHSCPQIAPIRADSEPAESGCESASGFFEGGIMHQGDFQKTPDQTPPRVCCEVESERATSGCVAARRPCGTKMQQKKGRKKEYWQLPFFRSSVDCRA